MYCNLEPGSNRVTIGLRNRSAKKITILARTVVCKVQLANMVPKFLAQDRQMSSHSKEGEDKSWVLEQLDMGDLQQWTDEQQDVRDLCTFSDVFSENDVDLGLCSIPKHDIKFNDYQPFKERYRHILPHLFEELKKHF